MQLSYCGKEGIAKREKTQSSFQFVRKRNINNVYVTIRKKNAAVIIFTTPTKKSKASSITMQIRRIILHYLATEQVSTKLY